ncbi:MAG TPA: 2-oxoacid:acceptor oxidoreductase subunit alpha, partial [Candidatus Dormibacteraeota bacterium]|nr:2-oxoacid:acceptor oxidoreductase subunit alpha [Candidatus Dormibacteraeota bacterium]
MPTRQVVNDLTIQAATVNGSGSQSSNLVLTKAIFRMGIPVAPKNVFPSNIEGLPTWFDVRVSPQGYQCRSREVDILVALNIGTWSTDVAGVKPGGVVIHEAKYPVAGPTQRDDLTYYAVPFAQLAKEKISTEGLRKYLTNMIYVGVLAQLLDIDVEAIRSGLQDQFRKKPAAVDTNMHAVMVGHDYARENLEKQDPYRLERMTGVTEGRILMEGNQASALGALMGGATVAAWYPITPSSSLCENFIAYAERFRSDAQTGEHRYAVIQAEDELAALGMVFGATWAGARAFTSTSGPGLSLMAEFAGLGYYAELPAVIFDVQRVGPSTGLPTRTMQGDVSFAFTLSHGDTRHIVLLPGGTEENYEFAMEAFDLADRFQTPVFVLTDLDLGMNLWMADPLSYPDKGFDRGKVLGAEDLEKVERWGRYRDSDGDGIPWRTLPGTPNPDAGFFTRGSGHDEDARYSERPEVYQRVLDRLARKHEGAREAVPAPVIDESGNSAGIIAFGSTHFAVVEAREQLRDVGVDTDYLRIRALPFSADIASFIERHDRVYVVEQNRDGQMYGLLRIELPGRLIDKLVSIRHYNGVPIDAHTITDPVRE